MVIPVKVKKRLIDGVKRYKKILSKAQSSDINESDTVTIITDLLTDVFGYDKYSDVTSEFAIKKTFCDLAIKLNNEIKILIEVKSADITLNERHLKQAVDYGSNAGIDWVILTNGLNWKVYRIIFAKPVDHELVYEFNFTELNTRKDDDLTLLYMLCKETIGKKNSNLDEYSAQKQLLNNVMIGQIILSDMVLDVIRRTMKKISSDAKVTNDEIYNVLFNEVIKREALDDEKALDCKKRISRALKK